MITSVNMPNGTRSNDMGALAQCRSEAHKRSKILPSASAAIPLAHSTSTLVQIWSLLVLGGAVPVTLPKSQRRPHIGWA